MAFSSFLDCVFRLFDVALMVMPYFLLVARPGIAEFVESDMRSGPQKLDAAISEIFDEFQAANSQPAW